MAVRLVNLERDRWFDRDVVRRTILRRSARHATLDRGENVFRRRVLIGNIAGLDANEIRLVVVNLLLELLFRLLQGANAFVERGVGHFRRRRFVDDARDGRHAKKLRDILLDALLSRLVQALGFVEFRLNFSQRRLLLAFGWIEVRRGEVLLRDQCGCR